MKFKRFSQDQDMYGRRDQLQIDQDRADHIEKDIKYLDKLYSNLDPISQKIQSMALNHKIEPESVEDFHECLDNLHLAIKDIKSHLVYQMVHELSPSSKNQEDPSDLKNIFSPPEDFYGDQLPEPRDPSGPNVKAPWHN